MTEFFLVLKHQQTVSYVHVANLSFLLYEYFITFPLEVKYIWNAPWGFIKIVYFITRYLPFSDTSLVLLRHFYPHLSAKHCYNLFITSICKSISQLIFTVRVWAVWGKNKRSTFLLPIFFIMCWLPAYVITVQAVSTAKCDQDLIPRGCLATGKISTIRLSVPWGILLVYDMGEFFQISFNRI
ncbi:hypothetical protein BDQ17DRAFT_1472042 [Cyathus striatus]|nr:hypothetical protein BDQ17DRAFT_1472042 [Cyathus striatus]